MSVSNGARLRRPTASWAALGTTAVLRLNAREGEADAELACARAAVEAELDAVDGACSRFREDSELARVSAAGGRRVGVSALLAEALELALAAAELTDGLVDPCLGHALELAGYDRDFPAIATAASRDAAHGAGSVRPAPPQARSVRARLREDWRAVELDRESRTVRVPAGIALDLGATAKAWAADRAAAAASASSGLGALVSLGGDLATAGVAPARGWAVHVTDDHRARPDAPGQTIAIRDGGLASSSVTVRRWLRQGRAMHHIIDPATGAPAESRWRTASVAAATCAEANIASTAAILLSGTAPSWLARAGLASRLVAADGAVQTVGAWPSASDRQTLAEAA